MPETMDKTGRVHLLDELRGFLIIYVVIYHALYDLAVIFPIGIADWFFCPLMETVRDLFTGSLIVISGISSLYSRSNIRRGARTLLLALGLTLVTYIFMPDQLIIFGILHFFGTAMLLYGICEPLLRKIPTLTGAAGSLLLFFFTRHVYDGYLGLFGQFRIALPAFLYNKPWLFPVGFFCAGIESADYYPILPWFFLFLLGSFLGRYIRDGRAPQSFWELQVPWLAYIGRHTMIIYLLHQPIVYGLLLLIFSLINN